MRRRRYLSGAGAAVAAVLPGCAAVGSGGPDYDVGMTATAFDPVRLTVGVGEEVVWSNTSSRGHTVTAYDDALPDGAVYFASGGYASEDAAREAWASAAGGRITTGETFRRTFDVPGTYGYFCIPHERAGMVGTVVVTE